MLLLLNLLLVPPFMLALIFGYFFFFGGPLPHHYLYTATVAGSSATPAAVAAADALMQAQTPSAAGGGADGGVDDEDDAAGASAVPSAAGGVLGFLFPRKNNRSPTLISLLHRARVWTLGSDERTARMQLFRRVQSSLWRSYKFLLRRLLHSGELERMICDAQLTMVPQQSIVEGERVGFHPHLITLAVRIAAYLRASKQLRGVLAMEEEQAAQERVVSEATAAAAANSGAASGNRGMELERSLAGLDDDDTPLSTPALAAMQGSLDPSELQLGGSRLSPPRMHSGHAFSPVLSAAARSMAAQSPAAFSSSSSSAMPGFARPFPGMPSFANSSPSPSAPPSLEQAAMSSPMGSGLPFPPRLRLSSSASDGSSEPSAATIAQDARANRQLQLLVAVKGITRTSPSYASVLRPVLYRSLLYKNELEDFLRGELAPALAVKYDSRNAAHESWLQELWSLYLPRGPQHPTPQARISDDWALLGFQGRDPATDFRAMGVLGLRNLIEFARLAPIHAGLIMQRAQQQGIKWFGFAITGIALTADLVQMARAHTLDAYFYTYGATWASWHALYAKLFVLFDEFWQSEAPDNVMSYSSLHSSFLTLFGLEAQAFPFTHRALASDSFRIDAITPVTPRRASSGQAAAATSTTLRNDEDEDDDELSAHAASDDLNADALGAQAVSERVVTSRRGSKSASRSAHWALSRSVSPLSASRSVSCTSNSGSPQSPALSRSGEPAEAHSGVCALGNLLDPIVTPAQFARHKLPPWNATTA